MCVTISAGEKEKMDVKDILSNAAQAVDDAGIKGELRVVAFEKAVDMIAASAGLSQKMEGSAYALQSGGGAAGAAATGSLLAKVAQNLRVDVDTVKDVYHEADGKFDIIISPTRLEKAKSTGMKQLALLVVAARQGAELEEFTDADHVRYFAEQYKKYDSANFATDLKSMETEFRIRREGRKILLKLSRPGIERAAELVRRLGASEPAQ